ncbi:winged helix DNA-binding domain-containing protein [Kitasatospora sp. NPDC058170]|uniref:winged helix DNA-binding domain-containing protein n=1 Tax=Kitasatospora sp. NPDC058170 TaxID=3346364 RepID=UPI0036DDF31D
MTLTWPQVCARRLARHGLAAPLPGGPAAVAGAACGAHAQVMSAAELSIGLRMAGGTRADVRRALWEEHSLVKTFGPRGTVHLLPTADLPLWTGALAAVPCTRGAVPEKMRMTDEQTELVVTAIAEALADAELTADELSEAVIAATGPWAGDLVMPAFQGFWPRWRQALPLAAARGALCFGPDRGRKTTYTNPHRMLPGFTPAEPQAALSWLLRSYLYAYGPATPEHFARWLAAPTRWVEQLFTDDLVPVRLEGTTAWLSAGDTDFPPAEPTGLRLLPYFDAYTVGCHPRELVFPGPAATRALNRGQAGNYPVLLIDGTVAGVWHQRRTGRRLHLTVEPLAELTAQHLADLDAQAARIGEVLEATPELTIGPVSTGPHA